VAMLMQQAPGFGPDHVELIRKGPIDFLLGWIQKPDLAGHAALGDQLPWLFSRGGTVLSLDPAEDLAQAAAEQLTEPEASVAPARAVHNAWWWRAGDVGVLTRASATGGRPTLETVVVVDDRTERVVVDGHREAWEEWLRLANILGVRTQPTQIVALSELRAGAVTAPPEAVPGAHAVALPPVWQALVDLASDAERAILVDLAGRGTVPVPALGFETDDGTPIDLAWPEERIAVELDGDDVTRAELAATGWTWVPPDPDAIAAALAGAES